MYINNIGEKYGSFKLADTKTPFDPDKYNDYMRDFISRHSISPIKLEASIEIDDQNENTRDNTDEDLDEDMQSENDSTTNGNEVDTNRSDDDLDSDSLPDYNNFVQDISEGFQRICQDNLVLKKRTKKYERKINALEETNSTLKAENEALKMAHDQEIARLKEEHEKQIEQQKKLIQEAKQNKYCNGCDSAKPLDIYFCQTRCW